MKSQLKGKTRLKDLFPEGGTPILGHIRDVRPE